MQRVILVTDTSGKHGSVALARASDCVERALLPAAPIHDEGAGVPAPPEIHLIESVPLAGGTFSAQLVPQIAALLAKHEFSKTDIEAFVVVSGPGSFTGLRVGLAAIKALAEILHKPIVPVSLLEVLAVASRASGKLLAVLDAGRGEFYAGEYQVADGVARLLGERMLAKEELPRVGDSQIVVTSDKTLVESLLSGSPVSVVPINPSAVAELGWHKLQAGETVMPEQLEANYIRRSDAEIFAKSS
jgi:tRNA threonylcarbamoyladenosine biosynthesis protein TsaB